MAQVKHAHTSKRTKANEDREIKQTLKGETLCQIQCIFLEIINLKSNLESLSSGINSVQLSVCKRRNCLHLGPQMLKQMRHNRNKTGS